MILPATTMKHPSESQSQEALAGLVERVTYHNADNGFCVLRAKARGHRDVVTVVGHAAATAAELSAAERSVCSSIVNLPTGLKNE